MDTCRSLSSSYLNVFCNSKYLSSSDTLLSNQSALLSGVQSKLLVILGLLDSLGLLGDDQLNVGWGRLVGVNSTVSSVSSSSLLGGLVDLDVRNLQLGHVQALGLSVGLSVGQQVLDEVDGLGRPSGLGDTKLLTLGGSTDGVGETTEWDGSLVLQHLGQVLLSFLHVPAVDGLGSLTSVLERNSQVRATGRSRLSWVSRGSSVTNHYV